MRETLGDAEFSSYMQVGGRGRAGVRVMEVLAAHSALHGICAVCAQRGIRCLDALAHATALGPPLTNHPPTHPPACPSTLPSAAAGPDLPPLHTQAQDSQRHVQRRAESAGDGDARRAAQLCAGEQGEPSWEGGTWGGGGV